MGFYGGCGYGGYGYGGGGTRIWQWLCFNHRIIHFINHHRLCLLGRIWRLLIIRNNDEQLHFH